CLDERLAGELPQLLDQWRQDVVLPESGEVSLPGSFQARKERGMFQLSLLVRMIFSCLVDADFIDTDEFYRKTEGLGRRRVTEPPSLEILRERLNEYLKKFRPDSEVDRLCADIMEHVRKRSVDAPGLFSLTVPTGGGKTLASLAFALDHAIQHGLRRIIYVIPFTSIVEQNAQVFRSAFGDVGEDAVLEHHSAFYEDPETSFESIQKRKLAMENWDMPVVVTTA